MNNTDLKQLQRSLALKLVRKIIILATLIFFLLWVLCDGILNDFIAKHVSNISLEFYYFCMINKPLVLALIFVVIFIICTYFVIHEANAYFIDVSEVVDQILHDPSQEIQLSSDMIELENRFNHLRINLIQNQNKAKEEQQKKDDLIMYMAHDLKNPLTSTIGYLNLLAEEKEISSTLREKYIKIALDKSLRVEELINQFFEITRYNLSDIPLQKSNIDLSLLLDQLIEEYYPLSQEKHLTIDFDKPASCIYYGDGDRLARAFGNLMKNAIHYSYENTVISIQLIEEEQKIKLSFSNHTKPLQKYQLDHIFDKFYRADSSRSSSTGGTGLGLAITKEIITLHSGDIKVINHDDKITFLITLLK